MNTATATVKSYNLQASNGRHIRVATKVVFADGREIRFIEKMSKRDALRNAQFQIEHGYFKGE
jgi:hypothetical protein